MIYIILWCISSAYCLFIHSNTVLSKELRNHVYVSDLALWNWGKLNLCWVDVQPATVVLCQSSTYWFWWWPSDRFIDYDINVIFYKLFKLILSHYYLDNFMDLLFKIMILWIFFCVFISCFRGFVNVQK